MLANISVAAAAPKQTNSKRDKYKKKFAQKRNMPTAFEADAAQLAQEFQEEAPLPKPEELAAQAKAQRQNKRDNKQAKLREIEKDFVPAEIVPEAKPAAVFSIDPTVKEFKDLAISDKLKQILDENGFSKLTEIQRQSIPAILHHRNVVLKSETGSGKTLAYLVPLIEYLSHYSLNTQKIHREESGTMAIIFAPTRELAVQIDVELKRLLKLFYYMVSTTIMGGESASREKARLRKGCVILICTPGRLLYHLQSTECLKLTNLQYMILDEADRMLDLGFEREMNECLELIKAKAKGRFAESRAEIGMDEEERLKTQTFHSDSVKINFVSATMSHEVEALGARLMKDYIKVGFNQPTADGETEATETTEIEDMVSSIPKQVQQFYAEVPTQYRLVYLLAFLYTHQTDKVIVFVSNCELANFLHSLVTQLDFGTIGRRLETAKDEQAAKQIGESQKQLLYRDSVCKLHGDMEHAARKANYFKFEKACQDNQGAVLICTDVASRGLDFKHVEWILQYDLSSQIKEYANRIGRTARIASTGSGLCFVMPQELKYVSTLEKKYKITLSEKSRYRIFQDFEKHFETANPNLKYKFRKLVNIEDKDEQQESLHALRQALTAIMLD